MQTISFKEILFWTVLGLLVAVFVLKREQYSNNKPAKEKSKQLQLCIIERPNFYTSEKVIDLLVEDIKKYGNWSNIDLKKARANPPEEFYYFFPNKRKMDEWVEDRVYEICGDPRNTLSIVFAGIAKGEESWGYAHRETNTVVVEQHIMDATSRVSKAEDLITEAIILHEIGHLWGLEHNNWENCLMNPLFDGLKIEDDDINSFNKEVEEFLDNKKAQNISPEVVEDELREKLGFKFCDQEIRRIKSLKSPLLGSN